jgi:hypothetical protein
MESKDIISGSKLIAEYMNLIYLPFSAELKEKGMKAGYYQTVSAEPKIEKTIVNFGDEQKEMNLNMNLFRYHNKNGWKLFEGNYYKYICRHHSELRFWNSLDALAPVIQKIKKDFNIEIWISPNGAEHTDFADKNWKTKICQSYNKNLQLSNNVFIVVVETLTYLEARGRN